MASETNRDDELTACADELCRALGYVGQPTFYDRLSAFERIGNRHVIEMAFGAVGIHSVYGLAEGALSRSFKPTLYVGCAWTDADADAFHRRAWTQGAVPLLLVVRPKGVEIRNGFAPPYEAVISRPFAFGEPLHPDLDAVSARALTNSLHWRDRNISRASAIDARLIQAIEDLNRIACARYPDLNCRRRLVNALIGRFIYLYVLIDRGIISKEWMRKTIEAAGCAGAGFADDAVRQGARPEEVAFSADEVWAVLRGVDRLINGSVFAITRKERSELPLGLVHTMHRVLRCADIATVEGRQVSFLDVSFEVLQTETISAIYEYFVRSEDTGLQKSEGVYYTPPFMADYVLSEVERELPLNVESRVLDCTAGSGVFLVSAYRRIMERATPAGGWGLGHADAARNILTSCIHGIEKNPQAANVCRFSLYLTMLDYVGQNEIETLASRFPRRPRAKLFPRLNSNVFSGNAFEAGRFAPATFTHVIGNPPWAQTGRGRYDRNSGEIAVRREVAEDLTRKLFVASLTDVEKTAHGRLSDLLTWAALRYLAPRGVLGLVLPTNSFVGRQSGAFGTALAETTSIRLVANLSHLRYHLFVGAKGAATVVVIRKVVPAPLDPVTVYRPRLPSLPLGRSKDIWSLLTSQTDLHIVRSRDLRGGHNGWFEAVALGPYDRRLRNALGTWAEEGERTVGGLLQRSGLRIRRGGSPQETGLSAPGYRAPVRRSNSQEPKLQSLDKETFAQLPKKYRDLFRAGTILVPRTLRGLKLLDEPYAFTSTYNAIVPSVTGEAATLHEEWLLATTTASGTRRQALLGLIEFFKSDVVGYFATIYGANTQVEDARFEQGDLMMMPCPFADLTDQRLAALSSADDVNTSILEAMNAGADFKAAVQEHVAFSKGYLDGKTPSEAFDFASRDQMDRFSERFERELRTLFTAANAPKVIVEEQDKGLVRLDLSFGNGARPTRSEPPVSDSVFVAASVIDFDPNTRLGTVLKSRARFAWTSDQAVADADAVARVVRGAGRA